MRAFAHQLENEMKEEMTTTGGRRSPVRPYTVNKWRKPREDEPEYLYDVLIYSRPAGKKARNIYSHLAHDCREIRDTIQKLKIECEKLIEQARGEDR